MAQIKPSIHQFQKNLQLLRGHIPPQTPPAFYCFLFNLAKSMPQIKPSIHQFNKNLQLLRGGGGESPLRHPPAFYCFFFLIWQKVCTNSSHLSINFKKIFNIWGGHIPLKHPLRSCSLLVELKTVFFLNLAKSMAQIKPSIAQFKKKSSTSEGGTSPLRLPLRHTVFFLIWQKVCPKSSHLSINLNKNLQLLRGAHPLRSTFFFNFG